MVSASSSVDCNDNCNKLANVSIHEWKRSSNVPEFLTWLISNNKSLRRIYLKNSHITEDIVAHLMQEIVNYNAISIIEIKITTSKSDMLSKRAVNAVTTLLAMNTVEVLDISGFDYGSNQKMLIKAINANTSLLKLNLLLTDDDKQVDAGVGVRHKFESRLVFDSASKFRAQSKILTSCKHLSNLLLTCTLKPSACKEINELILQIKPLLYVGLTCTTLTHAAVCAFDDSFLRKGTRLSVVISLPVLMKWRLGRGRVDVNKDCRSAFTKRKAEVSKLYLDYSTVLPYLVQQTSPVNHFLTQNRIKSINYDYTEQSAINEVHALIKDEIESSFSALTRLPLQYLDLTEINPPISNISPSTSIKFISLAHNNLTVLPITFLQLFPELRSLDLSYNKISEVDDTIDWTNFSELLTFNLSNNQITTIPTSFGALLKLNSLLSVDFSSNNITDIPSSVLSSGRKLLTYLTNDKSNLTIAKVIILGHFNSGKTTLLRALLSDFENLTNTQSTISLDVCSSSLNTENLIFRFFDFAGQIEYLSSHQLFFGNNYKTTNNTLIILLALDLSQSLQQQESHLLYWISFLFSQFKFYCKENNSRNNTTKYYYIEQQLELFIIGTKMNNAVANLNFIAERISNLLSKNFAAVIYSLNGTKTSCKYSEANYHKINIYIKFVDAFANIGIGELKATLIETAKARNITSFLPTVYKNAIYQLLDVASSSQIADIDKFLTLSQLQRQYEFSLDMIEYFDLLGLVTICGAVNWEGLQETNNNLNNDDTEATNNNNNNNNNNNIIEKRDWLDGHVGATVDSSSNRMDVLVCINPILIGKVVGSLLCSTAHLKQLQSIASVEPNKVMEHKQKSVLTSTEIIRRIKLILNHSRANEKESFNTSHKIEKLVAYLPKIEVAFVISNQERKLYFEQHTQATKAKSTAVSEPCYVIPALCDVADKLMTVHIIKHLAFSSNNINSLFGNRNPGTTDSPNISNSNRIITCLEIISTAAFPFTRLIFNRLQLKLRKHNLQHTQYKMFVNLFVLQCRDKQALSLQTAAEPRMTTATATTGVLEWNDEHQSIYITLIGIKSSAISIKILISKLLTQITADNVDADSSDQLFANFLTNSSDLFAFTPVCPAHVLLTGNKQQLLQNTNKIWQCSVITTNCCSFSNLQVCNGWDYLNFIYQSDSANKISIRSTTSTTNKRFKLANSLLESIKWNCPVSQWQPVHKEQFYQFCESNCLWETRSGNNNDNNKNNTTLKFVTILPTETEKLLKDEFTRIRNLFFKFVGKDKEHNFILTKIIYLHNSELEQTFNETYNEFSLRNATATVASPSIYDSDESDVKAQFNNNWRKIMLSRLKDSISNLNSNKYANLALAWHGTSEAGCFGIAESNFRKVEPLSAEQLAKFQSGFSGMQQVVIEMMEKNPNISSDLGFYGRGIYFSQFPNYGEEYANKSYFSLKQARSHLTNSSPIRTVKHKRMHVDEISASTTESDAYEEHPLLLCYLLLGNVFPVVEHPVKQFPNYHATNCKAGFDSHYTIVNEKAYPCKLIAESIDDLETIEEAKADELVIFNPKQILPKYIVYFKRFDANNAATTATEGNGNNSHVQAMLACSINHPILATSIVEKSKKIIVLWIDNIKDKATLVASAVDATTIVNFCTSNNEAIVWIKNNKRQLLQLLKLKRFKVVTNLCREVDGADEAPHRVLQILSNKNSSRVTLTNSNSDSETLINSTTSLRSIQALSSSSSSSADDSCLNYTFLGFPANHSPIPLLIFGSDIRNYKLLEDSKQGVFVSNDANEMQLFLSRKKYQPAKL